MRRRNIIFDVTGVLFNYNPAQEAHPDEKLFVPLEEGIALLKECAQKAKEKGHTLFICTNLHMTYLEILKQEYPEALGLFKAMVTPSTAMAKKPNPQIFQYLLDRYHLVPQDSVFIDDQESNIDAAKDAGMVGIHAQDFSYVRSELKRLGIL